MQQQLQKSVQKPFLQFHLIQTKFNWELADIKRQFTNMFSSLCLFSLFCTHYPHGILEWGYFVIAPPFFYWRRGRWYGIHDLRQLVYPNWYIKNDGFFSLFHILLLFRFAQLVCVSLDIFCIFETWEYMKIMTFKEKKIPKWNVQNNFHALECDINEVQASYLCNETSFFLWIELEHFPLLLLLEFSSFFSYKCSTGWELKRIVV